MLRNMKVFITAQQQGGLKHFHDILHDKHICARIKAILPAHEDWRKETIESGHNLNPIAQVWKLITEHTHNNRYFRKIHVFRGAIFIFF